MKKIVTFLSISFLAAEVLSQVPDSLSGNVFMMDLEELMNIKVSIATKSEVAMNESPSTVTVITSEEIKNMGFRQLEDILQIIPGYDLSMTYNSYYTVGIRGVRDSRNTSKLLVMVDGNPINQIFHGCAVMYGFDINIDNIERIEVIRGPGSALYGRNALSGVINIVTKSAASGEKVMVKGNLGTFNTRVFSGFIGYEKNDFNASISLRKIYTNYSDELYMGEVYDISRDNMAVNTTIEYGNLQFSGLFHNIRGDVYSTFVVRKPFYYSLSYTDEINPKISTCIKLRGHNEYYYEDIELAAPDTASYFPLGLYVKPGFKEYGYGIENEFRFRVTPRNNMLAGIQADLYGVYQAIITSNADSLANPLPYPLPGLGRNNQQVYEPGWVKNNGHKYNNMALLVQDIWHPVKSLSLTLGARLDYDSQIGAQFNPRVGFVFQPVKNGTVKVLYGRAYRAPGAGEQYTTLGFAFGNEELKPEIINTFEFSVQYRIKGSTSFISFYRNLMTDMIYAPLGTEINPDFKYHNIGKNTSTGIEFENKTMLGEHFFSFVNASYCISENTINLNDKDSVYNHPDIAPFKLNAGINYQFLKYFNANLYMFYRSTMKKFLAPDPVTGSFVEVKDPIGNYAIFNGTLRIKDLIRHFEFSGSIYNIFDTKYYGQDNERLNQPSQPGRQLLFGLSYTF